MLSQRGYHHRWWARSLPAAVCLGAGGMGSIRHRGSFQRLLTEFTPVSPQLPKPCCANPVHPGSPLGICLGITCCLTRAQAVPRSMLTTKQQRWSSGGCLSPLCPVVSGSVGVAQRTWEAKFFPAEQNWMKAQIHNLCSQHDLRPGPWANLGSDSASISISSDLQRTNVSLSQLLIWVIFKFLVVCKYSLCLFTTNNDVQCRLCIETL